MTWHGERAGTLVAEHDGFQLIVEAWRDVGDAVPYVVRHRGRDGVAGALLGSGTGSDVRAAIAAAERMAERCAALRHLQPVSSQPGSSS